MKTKIVILQTSHHGFVLCREELEKMGLVEGKDFQLLDGALSIDEDLTPGQRQLFITGTFSGSEKGVAEMVQKARQCNPELVCMSFALSQIAGPFDHQIVKDSGRGRERLVAAVKGFLDGSINRTNATWTPPAPKKEQWHWAL